MSSFPDAFYSPRFYCGTSATALYTSLHFELPGVSRCFPPTNQQLLLGQRHSPVIRWRRENVDGQRQVTDCKSAASEIPTRRHQADLEPEPEKSLQRTETIWTLLPTTMDPPAARLAVDLITALFHLQQLHIRRHACSAAAILECGS